MSNLSSLKLPPYEKQLETVIELNDRYDWGLKLSDLPIRTPNPRKLKPNEQYLLSVQLPRVNEVWSVQRTFDKLWEAIPVPEGFKKERMHGLRSDNLFLKHAQETTRDPGAYLVIVNLVDNYEREFGDKGSPKSINNLAGAEMFMLAIYCPEIFLNSENDIAFGLAGYTFRDCRINQWTITPCLCVLGDKIYLCLNNAVDSFEHWIVPEISFC